MAIRGFASLEAVREKQSEVSTEREFVAVMGPTFSMDREDVEYLALGHVMVLGRGHRDRMVYGADGATCMYGEIVDEVLGIYR